MRRPRFIAEHARNASGPLGRLIAFVMARETWIDNLAAIDALRVRPNDHVLDIGCGHGRSLTELANRAPRGRAAGVDPSELMTEIAVERNRDLVRAKRIDVALSGVEDMPYDDGAFDKALCVHVLYFWPDLDAALAEIARVLRPGGQLALLFRDADDKGAVAAFPNSIYTFRPLATVVAALEATGFNVQRLALPEANGRRARPRLLIAERSPS